MEFCTDPNALKLINVVLKVINVLKVAIIVVLIVMGMIDFFKSVFSKDAEENKKNSMLFVKRLISAALVFLLPAILELVIDIIGGMNTKIDLADCVRNVDNIAYYEALAKAKEEQNKVVVNESKENAAIKNNEVPGGTEEGIFIGQKYDFEMGEEMLYGLTHAATNEQHSVQGAAAQATLFANRFEIYGFTTKCKSDSSKKIAEKYGTGKEGLFMYVDESKWFASGTVKCLHQCTSKDVCPKDCNLATKEMETAVYEVLVLGKRTMPVYITEHDCWNCNNKNKCSDGKKGDICSITNGDNKMTDMKDIKNRDNYIQDVTKIRSVYSGNYVFYTFPSSSSDPFGYLPANKKKYGN